MYQVYLEYYQDQFTFEEEDYVIDLETGETGSRKVIAPHPLYLYREPIDGAMAIEIGFNPEGHDKLHIVVVRFTDEDHFSGGPTTDWLIRDIFPTRREAREMEFKIQSREDERTSKIDVDEVLVETLFVED